MRTPASLRRLVLSSLLLPCAGLWSCSGLVKPWSQPPVLVDQPWQTRTLLVEPGRSVLGSPSVFLDDAGRPAVVLADQAFYMGTQTIALARRNDQGWRVEFPLSPAAWRVCGHAGKGGAEKGGAVVVTHGDLDGELEAVRWDGVTAQPAEPGPCPRLPANVREATAADGTHRMERSRDGRTLWHEPPSGTPCPPLDAAPGQRVEAFGLAVDGAGHPVVALFERPEQGDDALGRLRHTTCGAEGWISSIVADGVRVTGVGLSVDESGRSHVAYVAAQGDVDRLIYAMPVQPEVTAPADEDRDARVEPALEACLRLWPAPPQKEGTGVQAYQHGDGLRCAVLERDPAPAQQALAALGSRCDAGQAQACAVAGSLHHWLMGDVEIVLEIPTDGTTRLTTEWRGLRAKGVAEDPGQARPLYGRACELGDARACLHHAVLLPHDDPQRLPHATTACDAGLPHACALAVAASAMRPHEALAARAQSVLQAACEADDAAACNDLGVVLHLRGDAAGARAAIDRSCAAKVEPACRNLERLR